MLNIIACCSQGETCRAMNFLSALGFMLCITLYYDISIFPRVCEF